MRAIASPNVKLPLALPAGYQFRVDETRLVLGASQPHSHGNLGKRFGEGFEIGTLIALIGMAVMALSIPALLVVVSIVNVLSALIGRIS